MVSAEVVSSLLERGTQYVADCEGDVPLHTRLPYISGATLEEQILAPAGLEDDDSGLAVGVRTVEITP